MFVAVCLNTDNNPVYITLKLNPVDGEFFRNSYEDIIPGYYMNKTHWNSIKADGNVPDDVIKELLDKSYNEILNKLSKKETSRNIIIVKQVKNNKVQKISPPFCFSSY